MLIVVLFCWVLELAIAANEDGYNEIVPSILFGEYHSTPQCPQGYSGQYPNCVPPYASQNLSPLSPTPPPNKYIPPSTQCPPGSVGQIPFCKLLDRKYVPPTENVQHPQQQCPAGTIGYYPDCQQSPTPQPPTSPPPQPPTPPLPPLCPFPSVGQFPNCEIQQDPTPPLTAGCPLGTYGYYPNCIPTPSPTPPLLSQCPFGSVGHYPDCKQLDECPPGSIGYYPNCQLEPPSSITLPPQCPFGSVGEFPDCQKSPQCPPGMIGYYPFCVKRPVTTTTTTKKPTPTPTKRLPPQCPLPTIGEFPNCEEPKPSRAYLNPLQPNPRDPTDPEEPPPLSWCIIGWDEYKTRYNKSYSPHQEVHRRVLFEENQKLIESHNALYEQGKETYSLCTNKYSDWTMDEYERLLGMDYLELPFPSNSNETDMEVGYEYDRPSGAAEGLGASADAGDGLGAAAGSGAAEMPEEWDWRTHNVVSQVKDQGNCETCWAYSAVGALESQLLKNKRNTQLSEQQLIDCTKPLEKRCLGAKSFPHLAFEYTDNNAITTASEYPNLATVGAGCQGASNGVKSVTYHNITGRNEVMLKKVVYMHGPVSAGIDARDEHFKSKGPHGVYYNRACKQQNNHAILIVGYGYDTDVKMEYWLIKNSFGDDWGDKGFKRILRGNNHCGIAETLSYPVI